MMHNLPSDPRLAWAEEQSGAVEEPIRKCDGCGWEMYAGDKYLIVDGEVLCEECVMERMKRLKGEEE